jgi:hypothetical protein
MKPGQCPFQEPDERQLLLIVDARDSHRIGHEETANKIFVYKRPIRWPWGAMTDCLRTRGRMRSWLVSGSLKSASLGLAGRFACCPPT